MSYINTADIEITSYTCIGIGFPPQWELLCPCGIKAVYPINGLPEVDTLHPCGKPNHWTVRYGKQS